MIALFAGTNAALTLLKSEARLATAATCILGLNDQLRQVSKKLAREFDAIQIEIDKIVHIDSRRQLAESTELVRETLLAASHLLSRQLETSVRGNE